jgi:hypothetical protein
LPLSIHQQSQAAFGCGLAVVLLFFRVGFLVSVVALIFLLLWLLLGAVGDSPSG